MKIDNLPYGTQLIWDSGEHIYPAIVGIRHPEFNNKAKDRKWVKIHTPNTNWMGPEEKFLRRPNAEELKTLKWPKI